MNDELDPTSPAALAFRIQQAAFLEAAARAKKRGLSETDIAREQDDHASPFWGDAIAISRRLQRAHGRRTSATIYEFKRKEDRAG